MTGLYVASNPTALSSQFSLVSSMGGLADTLERLSTGLKINSGKDDPAGLIASSMLKSEITGTTKAITNTQRSISMISTADSSLGQINSLLTDIKGLVVEGANSGTMNAQMIAANQMQINASIEAIDRIAKQTSYNGQKLLDGSMGFRTRATGLEGDPNAVGYSDLQINSANFGTASSIDVNVNVQETAKRGTLYYNGTGVAQRTTIDVTGSIGTQSFTFGANTDNSTIAASINKYSDSTGVRASVEGLASRGTAVLSTAGANNDIVITAKENGKDQGNYAFKVVYGDQENVRIASQATATAPGVVEVMLQRSYSKSYENFAGILDIDINTGDAAADTSVSIVKGNTTSATYYADNSSIAATSQDGSKSVTMSGSTTTVMPNGAASATTSWAEISKLNGWTIEFIDDASGDAGVDYESKTIKARQHDANDIVRALNAVAFDGDDTIQVFGATATTSPTVFYSTITETGMQFNDENGDTIFELTQSGGSAFSIPNSAFGFSAASGDTAAFAFSVGDKFVLGGGGAKDELQITYAEGATVQQVQDAINKTGRATAALAKGVSGDALLKNLIKDPSRVSGESVVSKTTSNATAAHVVELINNKLGSMFEAALLSGDSGIGLVGYMDGSVISGDVNLDNAIRFMGMDSGPVVRMVTTDKDGKPIANQKLGVTLINPSEADIAAGRNTPILQINLATDASGNSITTARDIVELFKNLTPTQTGGISATLQLPDGVDPNGRIWTVDDCGNEKLIENCDVNYGYGIVKPTGNPGTCDIQQNDLVILGQNQTLVDTNTIARIGNSAVDGAGAAVTAVVATAARVAENNSITTADTTYNNHEGLNGVTIKFTNNDNLAGFDENEGTLMVFISPETMILNSETALETAFNEAINGAIAQNWQGIRQFNNAVGDPTTVAVDFANTVTTGAAAMAALEGAHFWGDDETITATANKTPGTRGKNENSAALIIESLQTGTSTAGVQVYLEQDDTLPVFDNAAGTQDMIKVSYDEKTGELRIKANMGTTSGALPVSSGMLAELLNNNDVFNNYFLATGNVVGAPLTTPNPTAPDPKTPADWAGVYFSSAYTPAGEFVGGREIRTSEKATGGKDNDAETSNGIAMTGNNDDNQRLKLEATETGSRHFVQVSVAEGTFRTFCPQGNELSYLAGTDAVATINGIAASADGNKISVDSADLSVSLTTDNKVGHNSFKITGGGAILQLGPNVVSAQQMRLGIGSMLSTQLGGTAGKLFQLKTGGDADITKSEQSRVLADSIVNQAITYVANTRGRLGAIQRSSLEPNVAMLQDSLLALSEANQQIEEADFAEESSNLTRYQLLIQSGMTGLSLANSLPQYAASLIRG